MHAHTLTHSLTQTQSLKTITQNTQGGSTLPVPVTTLPCGLTWAQVFAQFPQLSVKRATLAAHPQVCSVGGEG